MKKIVLVLAILIGATASVPALRTRAETALGPTFGPYVNRVLNPIRSDLAQRHDRALLDRLREVREGGTPLPAPDGFKEWIHAFVQDPGANLDPWGHDYILVRRDDSIFVASVGPDGKRGTADDVVAGIPTPTGN